jgi:hypothetical protein
MSFPYAHRYFEFAGIPCPQEGAFISFQAFLV